MLYLSPPDRSRGEPRHGDLRLPLVIGDCVHLAALGGTLYALHRDTGKLQWKLRPLADSDLFSSLGTDGVRLFATTRKSSDKGESAVLAIGRP